jgi:hypothetical protein
MYLVKAYRFGYKTQVSDNPIIAVTTNYEIAKEWVEDYWQNRGGKYGVAIHSVSHLDDPDHMQILHYKPSLLNETNIRENNFLNAAEDLLCNLAVYRDLPIYEEILSELRNVIEDNNIKSRINFYPCILKSQLSAQQEEAKIQESK